ncbi:MAG: secretin N-terminal domain-containing protein [Planctomycetota bacterium]
MTTHSFTGLAPVAFSLVSLLVASPLRAQEPDLPEQPRAEVVLTIDTPAEAPVGHYVLQHTTGAEIGPILEEVINDEIVSNAEADPFTMEVSTAPNSVLLNGTEEQIARAKELLARLDVEIPEDTTSIQVVELSHVPAAEALETLREVIRDEYERPAQIQSEGQPLRRRSPMPQIVANESTNMLMFSGRPSQLLWIEHQISELEAAADESAEESTTEIPENRRSGAPGFDVEIREGVVHLGLGDDEGAQVKDFIKLAQRLLGKPILFHNNEIGEHVERIQFVGTLQVEQAKFRGLFDALMHSVGFACIDLGHPDSFQAIEVVTLNGPLRGRVGSEARVVPLGEVSNYKDHSATWIAVTMPLKHLQASALVQYLRPFLAQFGNYGQGGFSISADTSNSLLLAGSGAHVSSVVELIRMSDASAGESQPSTNDRGR